MHRRAWPAPRCRSQRAGLVCAAGQAVGKFISKTPIPAFIPRQDLMDQLLRWATFEAADPDALAKFDLPIKVTPYYKDGANRLWGMSIAFVKDGVTATTLGVKFDEEEVERHEWVGRGADGFPTLEGNLEDVVGANLEIRCRGSHACAGLAILASAQALYACACLAWLVCCRGGCCRCKL